MVCPVVQRLVGGLGSAAFHPSGTGIARAASGDRKELAMGMFSAGGMLGLALGLAPAMGLGYLTLVPAALLTLAALAERPGPRRQRPGATRATKIPVASCGCPLYVCGDARAAGG
jgi:MFS family permease